MNVVHVLDESEVSFPFDRSTRFEGLEGLPEVVTDPLVVGGAYRRAMAEFCTQIEVGCRQMGADYHRMQSNSAALGYVTFAARPAFGAEELTCRRLT